MKQSRFAVGLPAAFCCLLWGSAIPCINIGYNLFNVNRAQNASLIYFAGWRFMLAGILTLLMTGLILRRRVVPTRRGWLCVLKLAAVQTVLQYVLFYIGVANTPSSQASIIQGIGPFVSILIACYFFHVEKMTRLKWIGGLLGAGAIVLVNMTGQGVSESFSPFGVICLLLSMSSGACSAVMIKRYGRENDSVVLNGWQFFIGGMVMLLIGRISGGELHPTGVGAYGMLGYLSLLSALAYSVWSVLLTRYPVSRVTVYQFLQPMFGVALALVLLGQKPAVSMPQLLTALLLASASIYVVGLPEKSA